MAQTAAEQLAALTAQITRATSIDDGVIAYIGGVPALIKAAVDAAVANGATAEQLQPVTELGTALDAKTDAIVAAMNTNVPPADRIVNNG